jgi:hypothetical protein
MTFPRPLIGRQALANAQPHAPTWLWHGYLAPGAVTLLTGLWKTGKTTLVSVLLARMKSGGTLAGRAVAAGKALVVTEEAPSLWLRRHEKLDFGDHIAWQCRPFLTRPSAEAWAAFNSHLLDIHQSFPFSLLVIDPLAAFLAGSENSAAAILDALAPLRQMTDRQVSVLVLHHPAKTDRGLGLAARGSGAMSGFVDVLIEMRFRRRTADNDRRRRLTAFARYPETPRNLCIEWTADGTDYAAHDESWQSTFASNWDRLRSLFVNAPHKLNRVEIRECWPGDDVPNKMTLKRWLERAVDEGHLLKDGHGLTTHPYRYWLPEREAQWRLDPEFWAKMPELIGFPIPPHQPSRSRKKYQHSA